MDLTATQAAAIDAEGNSFLLGTAGTGKSTALQHKLLRLLESGEPAYTMMILVAEPEHEMSFLGAIHSSGQGPYAELQISTYNNMAREMLTLFWPLVARPAGFERAYQPPSYLGYDLAQLLMWQIVTPMIEEGAFDDLRLRPQQIVSQLLDTLNRAALNGLTLDQAFERQLSTWAGEAERLRHMQNAAAAARQFRQICLNRNLLDLSLIVQVFDTQLVQHPEFRNYFSERFRHLIVDNVEEQTPAGQNFVASLMNSTQTTSIAYDAGGGYKRFLAADPVGARQFRFKASIVFEFDESFIATISLSNLADQVENFLIGPGNPSAGTNEAIIEVVGGRYRREMIANLVALLKELVDDTLHPSEVAIITPYLDGALRYSLTTILKQIGLPYYLLRRRYSPRDEPRVRAWLTWLTLAHPDWNVRATGYDVAEALSLSIAGMDPARAQLVSERLYLSDLGQLLPVDELTEDIKDRVGSNLLELIEELRLWLEEEGRDRYPIDIFLHRLFNTLLAMPRYQPEPDLAGAAVCDWLVRTASRLRHAAEPMGFLSAAEIGRAFLDGIYQGLVTANPPELGDPPDPDGIMISTIYGYLLAGRPARVQVWLETAATGWWDIPRQPLSNAFVLAQSWSPDRIWTIDEEIEIRNQLLSRIIRGLTNRCSDGIVLASSDLDRRGQRQDGPLWRALQPIVNQN